MKQKFLIACSLSAAFTSAALAQGGQRQARMVGGGNPNEGKCTIEVTVDGAADVEIRGVSATLRTVSGQPAEWRRFECTSAMPASPENFRFSGVDGRGRQSLVRDPRNGGGAVVRIEDKDNGREGYTFDIFWGRGNRQPMQPATGYRPDDRQREGPDERYRPGWKDSDHYRRTGRGFTVEDAVRICKESVSEQARNRFRNREISFGPTRIDDQPGRDEYVIGSVEVRGRERSEHFRFSCSVNFDSGRVRAAQLDERPWQR